MLKKIIAVGIIATVGMTTGHAAMSELDSAKTLAGKWIIKAGNSSADFGLNNTITRKEIMKIVMNLSWKQVVDTCNGSFWDVTSDWGCKYIESALKNGFIATNAKFRPNDSISKAEAMKLILKARWIEKAYNTSDWQNDYALTAYDNGIVEAKYTDHTTQALRGWIFKAAAAWEKMMKDEDVMVKNEMKKDDVMEDIMVKDETTGYLDYSSNLIGKNDQTVLFFHATWCPSCNSADKNIKASWVDDFLILKVDYDSNIDLRKKYGVTSQHTFVQINSQWELIKKWPGSNSVDSIRKAINVEL